MKKLLLAGLVGTLTLAGASAADATPVRKASAPVNKDISVSRDARIVKSEVLADGVRRLTVADRNGNLSKRLEVVSAKSRINPAFRNKPAREASSDSYALIEDFNGWDGADMDWLPEGWTKISNSEREDAETWEPTSADILSFIGIQGVSGSCMAINYDENFIDEWLVTPQFKVEQDMQLKFRTLNDGVWYFSMDNVDWDTMEYVGDKILAYDQIINISTDGGQTWTKLKALSEDFTDMGFGEMLEDSNYITKVIKLSLNEYAGQDVMIGFQYIGQNGNTTVIDDVTVGLPELELSYANPTNALFYGMSPNSTVLNLSIMNAPVFEPVTWENWSWNEGATYSWSYFDSDNEWKDSNDQDALTVSFRTDYTSDFTTRNNLYYTPILKGSAPGASPGEYTRGKYVQAGGEAVFELTDGEGNKALEPFGMGVIDPSVENFTTVSDMLVPIFGYSPDSDQYWTDYTFNGEDEDDENNWVHMTSYMNVMYPGEAPIVIRGVWASALGTIGDDACFKAEIAVLTDEGEIGETIATATCSGAQVTKIENGGTAEFLTLNFTFDEPVVMTTDVCQLYVVRISGFRDAANVEYFTPVVSELPNPDGMAFGWISKDICYEGTVRESLTPAFNYTEIEQAFYIQLDAVYPWLQGAEEAVIARGAQKALTLDSYYSGENLAVENLPTWLTAQLTGRYGETELNLTVSDNAPEESTATITVKGAGVSHDVKVTVDKGNSILDIDSVDASEVTGIYTLQGVRVNSANAPGLYIVRTSDGKARKAIKK